MPADHKIPQPLIDKAAETPAREIWERLELPPLPKGDAVVSSPFREDKTPSFHVGGEKPHLFHDFGGTRDTFNSIQFVCNIRKCKFPEAVPWILNTTVEGLREMADNEPPPPTEAPHLDEDPFYQPVEPEFAEPARKTPKPAPASKPIDKAKLAAIEKLPLAKNDPKAAEMLLKEYGLAPEMIPDDWRVGVSHVLKERAIFYPGRDSDGKILAMKVKSLQRGARGKRRIKHEAGKGGAIALAGAEGYPGIVLVGGEEKAAAARAAGYYGVSPLAGEGHLPADWIDFFVAMQKPIILANDNDEAGEKANEKIGKALVAAGLPEFLVKKVWWPAKVKGQNDLNDVLLAKGPDGVRMLFESASVERLLYQADELTFYDAVADRPPPKYLLEGIIKTPSVSVFYGPPGGHKTNLLIDMSLCIAAGAPWAPPLDTNSDWEGVPTAKTGVLWVDCDMGEDESLDRVGAFVRGHKTPLSSPWRLVTMPHPWPDIRAQFPDWVRKIREQKIGLIVLDNLKVVCRGVEENSGEMGDLMAAWRMLSERTKCAIVFLHHQRKGNGKGGGRAGDSLRGHSTIEGSLDLAVHVQRTDETSDFVVLKSTKARRRHIPETTCQVCYTVRDGTKDDWIAAKLWRTEPPKDWNTPQENKRSEKARKQMYEFILDELENAGAIGSENCVKCSALKSKMLKTHGSSPNSWDRRVREMLGDPIEHTGTQARYIHLPKGWKMRKPWESEEKNDGES